MEDGNVFDGANNKASVLLQNDQRVTPTSTSCEVLDSLWMANSSSPTFSGSAPMVNFDKKTRERLLFPQSDKEEVGTEDYDRCFHQPEKKRRLTPEQVQFLERTFDVENKLEPERKVQLAKEVGLQPRQVAIWFQNRRARYKTKQLEKDYGSLKASFDNLKADYDSLLEENEKLKNEVQLLQEKLLSREKGKVKSEPCDPVSPADAQPENLIPTAVSKNVLSVPVAVCKQEDASSARSDVFDSDSPHYTDGIHSSLLEPDDSSHIFEPDLSDFSQDEDDSLRKSLLSVPSFPKLEDECYNDLQANSCMLGITVDDPGTWFWNC